MFPYYFIPAAGILHVRPSLSVVFISSNQ